MIVMHLLILALTARSSSVSKETAEAPRSFDVGHEVSRYLQDEPYEIAAIALGYPMQSSSDWVVGSTGPRAIMTKIFD